MSHMSLKRIWRSRRTHLSLLVCGLAILGLVLALAACGGGAKTLLDNAARLARDGSGVGSPWRMFGANSLRTRLSTHTGPPTSNIKWLYNTMGHMYRSAPVIAGDGTVYFGDRGNNNSGTNPQPPRLYAVSATGVLKWTYTTLGRLDSPALSADGSTIYAGGSADQNGQMVDNKLYAISSSGSLRWTFATGGGIITAPVIGADGVIYFGSIDGKLYAVYPNGSLKWAFTTGGVIRSSPAIGYDGTLYFGSWDNKMYAIYEHDPDQVSHPDGTLKWEYHIGEVSGAGISSSPAIGADGTVYVGAVDFGGPDNGLYAFNADGPDSSRLKWVYLTQYPVYASPAIGADGTIIFGDWDANFDGNRTDDGHLYAVNPNGTLKWSIVPPIPYPQLNTGLYASPALGADGTIYNATVGTLGWTGAYLFAINSDGTVKWSYLMPTPSTNEVHTVTTSAAIGGDGTVYLGVDGWRFIKIKGKTVLEGGLYAFGPGLN